MKSKNDNFCEVKSRFWRKLESTYKRSRKNYIHLHQKQKVIRMINWRVRQGWPIVKYSSTKGLKNSFLIMLHDMWIP